MHPQSDGFCAISYMLPHGILTKFLLCYPIYQCGGEALKVLINLSPLQIKHPVNNKAKIYTIRTLSTSLSINEKRDYLSECIVCVFPKQKHWIKTDSRTTCINPQTRGS